MATLAPRAYDATAVNKRFLALTAPAALAIVALATILLRIGTMWTDQLDWDEWSFILMGADVAQGHLPFVHQFDLKPPLIFFLFGAVIALFGKSLLAIRLLGAACVFAAATFVFLTGRRAAGAWPALGGALLTTVLASAPFGQATSTELPAIAFLAAATWCLTRWPLGVRDAAVTGVLVALAVLTRTNLALVAVVIGALLLAASLLSRERVTRSAWLAFAATGLVPPLLLVLTYAATDELATLKLAMIDVPLAYSGQLGMVEVARQHATQFYYTAQGSPLLYAPPALLAAAGAAFAVLARRHRAEPAQAWLLVTLFALTGAVAGSLLIGGAAYPHYWLQMMPFAGLFATLGIAGASRFAARAGYATAALVALPLAAGLSASLPLAATSYASPHPAQQAAAYIRATGSHRPSVWALHKHLTLWYLDAEQLSRAGVHPDNLARRAIIDTLAKHHYVGPDEVARLMALRPRFVITDAEGKGLAWVRADGKPIDHWLAANYRRDAQFGDVLVYRRR
jgi:4-amino-4-deoxy-L-arabinose transferase-like glycosyltransferase